MSVKTVLIAHRSLAVCDRFAAAVADARQACLVAGTAAALGAVLEDDRSTIDLALVDVGLTGGDPAALVASFRHAGPRATPVLMFAGSVPAISVVEALVAAGVAGFINEHADAPQILPALAPHLFPDSVNRRADPRVTVAVGVSYQAGQTIAAAQTRDIGRGGIGLQTTDPLTAGTPVRLTIRLPGLTATLSAFGRVIWSDRRLGMGVQFEPLPADAAALIERYLTLTAS